MENVTVWLFSHFTMKAVGVLSVQSFRSVVLFVYFKLLTHPPILPQQSLAMMWPFIAI